MLIILFVWKRKYTINSLFHEIYEAQKENLFKCPPRSVVITTYGRDSLSGDLCENAIKFINTRIHQYIHCVRLSPVGFQVLILL